MNLFVNFYKISECPSPLVVGILSCDIIAKLKKIKYGTINFKIYFIIDTMWKFHNFYAINPYIKSQKSTSNVEENCVFFFWKEENCVFNCHEECKLHMQ